VGDLSVSCCLNSECPDHGVRGGETPSVSGHYGKATPPIRFLRCRPCGVRFSERGGTPLLRSHLTEAKATAVLEHVADGRGVRQAERLVGVHRDTVARYIRKAGDHAKEAHDELVAPSPRTTEVPFDEGWSHVAKEEAHRDRRDPADDPEGDYWDHVA
jgi:hypothetical protein